MASSEPGAPSLPPLFRGEAAEDAFGTAVARARAGTDPGLVTHRIRPDHLSAALVLAPEAPLGDAMAMVLAAANGFADAFGALAPAEVACQFDWPGGIRINGGLAGRLRAAASTADPGAEPDWLVVGFDINVFEPDAAEPGLTPDRTTLWDEGCAEVEPRHLLESWSRHTLVWIHEWLETGMPRLHEFWRGRAYAIGKPVSVTLAGKTHDGQFQGIDERGGMLLKAGGTTRLLPLHLMLEEVPC